MPEQSADIVVVGGGLAGAKTVEALREKGFEGSLTIISAENELPYERPPLSKGYLQGDSEFADAVVHKAEWYEEHDVTLRLGVTVTKVYVEAKQLTLDEDDTESTYGYGKLVIATGASPRLIGVPGSVAENIYYLRTRADSDALRARFGKGHRVVIVGGGWIGLEVAAAARNAGSTVTLIEMAEQPLLAVLGEDMGKVFAKLHREHDVDLRLGLGVQEFTSENGKVSGVRLTDDSYVEADTVVVGVGIVPNLDAVLESGLRLDNGILVDASLRSSDPDVYAIGDVANHDHPLLGRLRVEHWANALNQPAVVAANLVGEQAVYDRLPYFFSDQYDLGMEYVGFAARGSYDRVVVRGDVDNRKFVAFWMDGVRMRAAMNVNVWDVPDAVRPIIAEGREILDDDRLRDNGVSYEAL
jgi:3-phenylpropionate/trans-cinnamate dioxygenase ferredoxin reductase component